MKQLSHQPSQTNTYDLYKSLDVQVDTNLQKFNELLPNKKKDYYRDRYCTVHGTTGFFDYWFHQSMRDYKNFAIQNTPVDVYINCSGGSYESGGGNYSNNIVVHVGDRKYTSEMLQYSNTESRSNPISHPNKDYKEIVDATYDASKDIWTVTVKLGSGTIGQVQVPFSAKYNYDAADVAKRWVPLSLFDVTQVEPAPTLPKQTKKQIKESQQALVEAMANIMAGGEYKARDEYKIYKDNINKILEDGSIVLTDDVAKNLITYYMANKSYEHANIARNLLLKVTDEQYKQSIYAQLILDVKLYIEKGQIELYDMIVQDAGRDKQEWENKRVQAFVDIVKQGGRSWSSRLKELDMLMTGYEMDKKEVYTDIYNCLIQTGYLIHDRDYSDKRAIILLIAKGMQADDNTLFRDGVIQSLQSEHPLTSAYQIPSLIQLMKKKHDFPQDLIYNKIISYEIPDKIDYSLREKIVPIMMDAYQKLQKDIPIDIYKNALMSHGHGAIKNFVSEHGQDMLTQDVMTGLAQEFIQTGKGVFDIEKIFRMHEEVGVSLKQVLVPMIQADITFNKRISNLHKAIEKNLLTEEQQAICKQTAKEVSNKMLQEAQTLQDIKKHGYLIQYADENIAQEKANIWMQTVTYSTEFDSFKDLLPHTREDIVIAIIQNCIDGYLQTHDSWIANRIDAILSRSTLSQNNINTLLEAYMQKNKGNSFSLLEKVQSFVDKERAYRFIKEEFDAKNYSRAINLAKATNVYDVRKKPIAIQLLKSPLANVSREYQRCIEDAKLEKAYYLYGMQAACKSGDLLQALQLSQQYSLPLTAEDIKLAQTARKTAK